MRLIDADKVKELIRGSLSVDTDADKEYVCGLIDEISSSWISVKDRLPVRPPDVCGLLVRRQWYLVALESGAVLTLSYEFDEDRWQGVGSPVTHWMPLPEPPKEDGNGLY